jgi:TolA-binding protein
MWRQAIKGTLCLLLLIFFRPSPRLPCPEKKHIHPSLSPMPKNLPANIVALAAVGLAFWILISTVGNSRIQQGIQAQQDQILTLQSEIQTLQQQLQSQQQQIETASQLNTQIGPAILNELATLQFKNNNIALAVFLQKHGIQANPPAPQPTAVPATKPSR